MCGFSGWVVNSEIGTSAIELSLQVIKHRGPDDTLIVSGDKKPEVYSCSLSNEFSQNAYPQISNSVSKVCFGFNRLSIVDLSDKAMQPILDAEQEIMFMMNGEIYNFAELKEEYLQGLEFHSASDSEVAFKLYLILGNSFVEKLKGMFSIVIFHYKTNVLKVWRDRLGIKPFYYAITEQGFVFSSEIKGIFATKLVEMDFNYKGLAYSMYLGTCPSPLTIYQNINSLEAGHFLEFQVKTKTIHIEPYWCLKYNKQNQPITSEEFNKDIEDICKLYATGEVKKSVMLSGGLDSGTLAYFYGNYDNSLEAVHIYQKTADSEYEFAQLNAQNAGISINNYEVSFTPNSQEIDFFLNSEEEPNTIPEPAFVLCDKIKKTNIKVLYNALGPDEIFGGYGYFQLIKKLSKYSSLLELPLFLFPKKHRPKVLELRKYGFDSFPFIARQVFTWDEIKQFLYIHNEAVPEHPITFIKNQIQHIYPEFNKLPILKKASYYDVFYYISTHHTFRCDQPSMLYGIEMRFPFLEHTFIEKYFNQAHTFDKLEDNLKPVFRDYVQSLLSPKVMSMKKKGFSVDIHKLFPNETEKDAQRNWYLLMLSKLESKIAFNLTTK